MPLDYRSTSIEEIVQTFTNGHGFDVVYDTVGGSTLDDAFEAVSNYNLVVSCYGWGQRSLMPLSRKLEIYSGVFVLLSLLTSKGHAHHGDILRQATQFAQTDQLCPVVDPRHFTLNTARATHEAVEAGVAVSKIAIYLLSIDIQSCLQSQALEGF